ncbi:MAG: alpha/beta hydrolase [Burkholderiaceae bacterium]|nr:alpha/beta hydrolase [Burkholderiaceae bacterium]
MKKLLITLAMACLSVAPAVGQTPKGEVKAGPVVHTAESRPLVVSQASIGLPASLTGAGVYVGPFSGMPATLAPGKAPVVIFLHGSSGLGLKAIGEWQRWLATLGIATIAPDSFALKGRLTYTSPIDKDTYESIHALRGSEIGLVLEAARTLPWIDTSRMVLAGTSEGAVSVARYQGNAFLGRIVFSWSCEDNYFVQSHATAIPDNQPTLNIISSTDPYFSRSNGWLGAAPSAQGYCGEALKGNKKASIVLIPGAPHTVLMFDQAKVPVEGFLRNLFGL